MKNRIALALTALIWLAGVTGTVEGQDSVVTPTGRTVDLAEAKHRVLVRLHKRHSALRPAIEREYARRCDPVALAEAERSAAIAQQAERDRKRKPRPETDDVAGHYGAAGEALGSAISLGVSETLRAKQVLYCAAADRLRAEEEANRLLMDAEKELAKRVDALTFYGMDLERALRVAANDEIYGAELARLQEEAKP